MKKFIDLQDDINCSGLSKYVDFLKNNGSNVYFSGVLTNRYITPNESIGKYHSFVLQSKGFHFSVEESGNTCIFRFYCENSELLKIRVMASFWDIYKVISKNIPVSKDVINLEYCDDEPLDELI